MTVIKYKSKFQRRIITEKNVKRDGKIENGKFRTRKCAYCKGQLCKHFDGGHLNGKKR